MSNWNVTYTSNLAGNTSSGIYGSPCPSCHQILCGCGSANSYINICAYCWNTPCKCSSAYKSQSCSICGSFTGCLCWSKITISPNTTTTITTTGTWFPETVSSLILTDALTNEQLDLPYSQAQCKEENGEFFITLNEIPLLKTHSPHICKMIPDSGVIVHPIIVRAQYTRNGEVKDTFLVLHGIVKFRNKQSYITGTFLEVTDNFIVIKLLASLRQYRKNKGGDIRE